MAILIQGGTVVTAADVFRGDVRIQGERVAAVGELGAAAPGDQVIDATGLLVLPGAVDVHTHFELPAGGTVSSDDFATGTAAAACGGTTTIIDFVTPDPGQALPAALEARLACAAGKAAIDYGVHMSILGLGPQSFEEMGLCLREGVSSFKIYTAYPGRLMLDDGSLYRVLRWARRHGALVTAHAENGPAIDAIIDELAGAGRWLPLHHGLSRPARLEGEATARVIALAETAEAPVYIVHVSCAEALAAVRDARRRGVRAFAETCPHYLYLSLDELARPDFEGAKFVCSPPLRPRTHAPELWRGLAGGDLDVVATDHCPFNFRGQKDLGREDFRRIPNGLPGVETRVPLMHQGVVDGKLSLRRMVEVVATAPARLFGLYPRKGTIVPGADADVVLLDPNKDADLGQASLHMRVDYSPYEGLTARGVPVRVFARGRLVADGGRFVGKPGDGRYLARGPSGAAG